MSKSVSKKSQVPKEANVTDSTSSSKKVAAGDKKAKEGGKKKKKKKKGSFKAATDFLGFSLDPRISRALDAQKIVKPTLVQSQAIPIALKGRDLLVRAHTGSGKTIAFSVPVLQRVLLSTETTNNVQALVLAPTTELASQLYDHMVEMTAFCGDDVTVALVSRAVSGEVQEMNLRGRPSVVVGTPGAVSKQVKAGTLDLGSLEMLVVDEADMLLSFGHNEDMQFLTRHLPRTCQGFLMSATLSEDVLSLKKLMLHSPAVLKLTLPDTATAKGKGKLVEYRINCDRDDDRFVVVFALLKLKAVQGRSIVFVQSVNQCFRLKLLLDMFGVPASILNHEMPANSRYHTMEEFNRGVCDVLIAVDVEEEDASGTPGDAKRSPEVEKDDKAEKKDVEAAEEQEYGVARGIDFKRVDAVINFDVPRNPSAYVHRVGRAARGGRGGVAITLSTPESLAAVDKISETREKAGHKALELYPIDMNPVLRFRYRVSTALERITRKTIKDARTAQVRTEILNSEKLREHFAANPNDFRVLRHDQHVAVGENLRDPGLMSTPVYMRGTADAVQTSGTALALSRRGAEATPTATGKIRFSRKKKKAGGKKAKKVDALASFAL